jgi:hypothetical protein
MVVLLMRQIRLPGYITLKMDSCASLIIDFDAQTHLALTAYLLENFISFSSHPFRLIAVHSHLSCFHMTYLIKKKKSKAPKTCFDINLLHVLLDRDQQFKINKLSTF